jgi:hypothetical protein
MACNRPKKVGQNPVGVLEPVCMENAQTQTLIHLQAKNAVFAGEYPFGRVHRVLRDRQAGVEKQR